MELHQQRQIQIQTNTTRPEIQLSDAQAAIFKHAVPYNLVFAGQGGGKSRSIGVLSALFVFYCPTLIGLIAANTYLQLSRATLLETFKTWAQIFGWHQYDAKNRPDGYYVFDRLPPDCFASSGHVFKSNTNNIYFRNGAVIFAASLENYKAIEGIEVGWALLDETADTKEVAVTEVITGRLRQKGLYVSKSDNSFFKFRPEGDPLADIAQPINPLFIFTKPAKVFWLNEMFNLQRYEQEIKVRVYSKTSFFHGCDGLRQVVCYSAFHNPFLPEGYLLKRMQLLEGSGLIGALFYGDPFAKMGDEFVTEFSASEHVVDIKEDRELPVHFTIDFNSKPYMSGLVCQITPEDGEWKGFKSWITLNIVDEYSNVSPRNSAGHLAQDLCADYAAVLENGMFVYGDASGNNSIPIKGVKSLFDDFFMNIPSDIFYEIRVPKQNPRYKAALGPGTMGRRAFMNAIFSGTKGVRVKISRKCINLISDLTMCKEDENGKLAKQKNKDGIEERGHHLDALQYLVCHPRGFAYLAKIKDI